MLYRLHNVEAVAHQHCPEEVLPWNQIQPCFLRVRPQHYPLPPQTRNNYPIQSFGFVGNNFEVPALSPSDLFHLSDNAVCCLSSMPFYEKMIKENQNPFAIASIIERLSILNLPFSMAIARVLLKVFNENTDASDDCDTVMLCITKLLNIKDAFWRLRA